jgi:hypothetical protein
MLPPRFINFYSPLGGNRAFELMVAAIQKCPLLCIFFIAFVLGADITLKGLKCYEDLTENGIVVPYFIGEVPADELAWYFARVPFDWASFQIHCEHAVHVGSAARNDDDSVEIKWLLEQCAKCGPVEKLYHFRFGDLFIARNTKNVTPPARKSKEGAIHAVQHRTTFTNLNNLSPS